MRDPNATDPDIAAAALIASAQTARFAPEAAPVPPVEVVARAPEPGDANTSYVPELLEGVVVGGRYRVDECIGVGGTGRVFRVTHCRLGNQFALKLLRSSFARDRRARARFLREARVSSALSHPHIVSVVDFGEDPEHGPFLVAELVDGEPLSARLRAAAMPVSVALDIAEQVGRALAYMHQRGVVHADLKPDNVFLRRNQPGEPRRWTAKLLDFGIASDTVAPTEPSAAASPTAIEGTPHYMSPERLQGQLPTPSIDIYAIGVLCYEMLTGRLPFVGSVSTIVTGHMQHPPPPLRLQVTDDLGPRLEALVMRALQKDPQQRHENMEAFLFEVHRLRVAMGGTRPPPTVRPKRRRPSGAVTAFDTAAVALAAIDTSLVVVAANPAFAGWLACASSAELEGQPLSDTRFGAALPEVMADLAAAVRSREILRRGIALTTSAGEHVQLELIVAPGSPPQRHMCITVWRSDAHAADGLVPLPTGAGRAG